MTLKRNLLLLAAAALTLGSARIALADPPADKTWTPIPELTDEFDGPQLDSAKWDDHDPKWLGREPALFMPSNVAIKDGILQISGRAEDPPADKNPNPKVWHTFTTGFVKSKTIALYGYYEVRAKVMSANINNGFWFYKVDPDWHTEIDVFEIFGGNEKQASNDRMTVHIFHTPTFNEKGKEFFKSGQIWPAPFKFADEFHVFGLQWDEKEIKWFVDGKLQRTLKNDYNHQALNLCLDAETTPGWMGLPTKESLPATFQIDYVRAWKDAGQAAPSTQPAAK